MKGAGNADIAIKSKTASGFSPFLEPASKAIELLKDLSYLDKTDKDFLFAEEVTISCIYSNLGNISRISGKIPFLNKTAFIFQLIFPRPELEVYFRITENLIQLVRINKIDAYLYTI